MAEQKRDYQQDPAGSPAGREGGTFKREGPDPAPNDTGKNVDEMNELAEASVINNVTPDEATD